MIKIYTICYNEELLLPFFIDWYKSRLDCEIVVYNNYSTDSSKEIALSKGCTVVDWDSGNQIRDDLYLAIKNNCWKNHQGWVGIMDVDEILDVYPESLTGTIVQGIGYNMVNLNDRIYLNEIKYGVRDIVYDKMFMFDTRHISEINYEAGCHRANPVGNVEVSRANCYHFKYLSADYLVDRYKMYNERLSDINKEHKWGFQYEAEEAYIREHFEIMQKHEKLEKVR